MRSCAPRSLSRVFGGQGQEERVLRSRGTGAVACAAVAGIGTVGLLSLGVMAAAGRPNMPREAAELVVGSAQVFWPWGVFASWVALQRGKLRRRAGFVALFLTAVGSCTLAYHVDEPLSALCALEWFGLPGWLLGGWILVGLQKLQAPEIVSVVAFPLLVYSSPVLWFAVLVWAGQRCGAIRTWVLFLPKRPKGGAAEQRDEADEGRLEAGRGR